MDDTALLDMYSLTMNLGLGTNLRNQPGPVLITGHTGFKGTWMTLLLEFLQIPVVGISLPPKTDSLYSLLERKGAIPESYIDIREFKKLRNFFIKYKPSVVLHMAAQPLVLESYNSPRETFEINIMGTANILDISTAFPEIRSVGVVTTDKVYRNSSQNSKGFIETDSLEGKDPYSASKVGTEAAVSAWRQISNKNKGQQIFSLRAGNVIGGGDKAKDRLLPDIVRSKLDSKSLVIRNSNSTRPWQHVLDPLYGYLLALDTSLNKEISSTYNFSPNAKSLDVGTVVAIANTAWENSLEFQILKHKNNVNYEAEELNLNSARALNELGWKPFWTQQESIISTVKWWRQLIEKSVSPSELCLSDIKLLLGDNKFANTSF
jgi:CDP-glucose 4,6-dehydratase